ncbi:hypothetical protein KPH14_012641 [Odynerus spinipes]|uniref:Uncharacterized protein n=1 Tax=Odynerus spinipes TaxID=1348599 RepID=A0AAD9VM29_9HYME|nr:hypothetical protein KPH14_012641 [Odynerus spinipes]
MTHLVQWNVNGFYTRLVFIHKLLKSLSPSILCIQETNFKPNQSLNLRGFKGFYKNRTNTAVASGGVATYIKDNIPCEELQINTALEAVVVSVSIPHKITICNVYLPNSYNFTLHELQDLSSQLPTPFILVGDFNSHNLLWGSSRTNSRGKIIENWLDQQTTILLNTHEPTHFNFSSGTFSPIDLSFCSPSLASRIDWSVDSDLHDSDHFPLHIKIHSNHNQPDSITSMVNTHKWIFKKADWGLYSKILEDQLTIFDTTNSADKFDVDNQLALISTEILSAAEQAIPITAGRPHKPKVPWWNESCEHAIKAAKHAFNVYKRHPSHDNKIIFKKLRAAARLTLKTRKKESWKSFITSINRHTPSDEIWKAIKRIKGKNRSRLPPFLKHPNGDLTSSTPPMAQLLADTFTANSSDNNYNPEFLKYKKHVENNIDLRQYSRHNYNKNDHPINSLFHLNELKSCLASYKYYNHLKIFTDGSIINGQRGCAIIYEDQEITFRLPDAFSILSCEAFAILEALDIVEKSNINPVAIFTDSKSTIDALSNSLNNNHHLHSILQNMTNIHEQQRQVTLV